MSDPRHAKLAKLLVNYCVEVQPGDRVMLRGGHISKPLMTEVYKEVIGAGGHPFPVWIVPEFQEIMLKNGNDDQVQYIPDPMKVVLETFECQIALWSDDNTRTLSAVDPARQQLAQAARREIMELSMKRSATGEFRWVGTMFPTNAHAQEADMSLSDFEDFVYSDCYIDKEDPVAEWLKVSAMQQKLVDWLAGKENVKVKGPNVDLTLSIAGRTFINSDGKHNMPSGEIFTGPVEDSCNGWVRYLLPGYRRRPRSSGRRACNSKMAKSSRRRPRRTRVSCYRHSIPTKAPATWANSPSAPTTGSLASPRTILYLTRRSAAPFTWRWAAGYPETGSKLTNHRSIGT